MCRKGVYRGVGAGGTIDVAVEGKVVLLVLFIAAALFLLLSMMLLLLLLLADILLSLPVDWGLVPPPAAAAPPPPPPPPLTATYLLKTVRNSSCTRLDLLSSKTGYWRRKASNMSCRVVGRAG